MWHGHGEIVLGTELLSASGAATAAVVSHEMQHGGDHAATRSVMDVGLGCVTTEINAFSIEALVWRSLDDRLGSAARKGHAVEAHLHDILNIQQEQRPAVIARSVGLYGHQCLG